VFAFVTRIFAGVRVVRMSSGKLALIRDLGLVKGGKGLRHHERLTLAGIVRSFTAPRAGEGQSQVSPDHEEPLAFSIGWREWPHRQPLPPTSFAKVSRNPMVLLNTGRDGVESGSRAK
jgi:hypothetical protein